MGQGKSTRENDLQCDEKLALLRSRLEAMGRVAIAFSAGVDSTLLLKVAHDALGDNAIAVTARSASVPTREIEEAAAFCQREGIRHIIVDTDEFSIEGFKDNPLNRCYLCKREILSKIEEAARNNGAQYIAEGSNADDDADYRPGFQAVLEAGVASPLRDAGLSKADVRTLAKTLGLEAWNKPAYACLNTRFPHGDTLTPERLSMVEQAEYALHDEGFAQVRVRVQETTARIEVPAEDIERLADVDTRNRIVPFFLNLGFTNVSLDLAGYRKGSMNETL